MNKLVGLVICGGQSTRMGEDKSRLVYHGKPQREYLVDLLQPFCEHVFISCNRQQAGLVPPPYEALIDEDKYSGIGPMAGLLSAHEKFPHASFLLVACDYPLITKNTLQHLIDARTGNASAVCFWNPVVQINEPLIAIYENNSFQTLSEKFRNNKFSLRHFLNENNACSIVPGNPDFLTSVDDAESFRRVKEMITANLN
jgi:molybdopterin-guanine dinucleotide biosynthesis protein A